MSGPPKIAIHDCGCVTSRPKEQSCKTYGTRWRVYVAIRADESFGKILIKCRDCGRMQHFALTNGNNPVLIQYTEKEEEP